MRASIKLATTDYESEIVALMREFYAHFEELKFDEHVSPAAVRTLLSSPDMGQIWLICNQGKVVGYMALTYSYSLEFLGRVAWIDELYVQDEHRGKGLGSEAIGAAAETCREVGVRAILLELDRINVAGGRLYSRLGFVERSHYQTMVKVL